jgi:hypothetical protein
MQAVNLFHENKPSVFIGTIVGKTGGEMTKQQFQGLNGKGKTRRTKIINGKLLYQQRPKA